MAQFNLNIVFELRKVIERLKEKIQRLKSWREGITACYSAVPIKESNPTSRVETLTAQIDDTEIKLATFQKQMASESDKLISALAKFELPDNELAVLVERYGFCKPFKKIAHSLSFSESHIYRLHAEGLRRLGLDAKTNKRLRIFGHQSETIL